MHYLVTGHTGFKGAWLTLLLAEHGHEVVRARPRSRPGGAVRARPGRASSSQHDLRVDIRDAAAVAAASRDGRSPTS